MYSTHVISSASFVANRFSEKNYFITLLIIHATTGFNEAQLHNSSRTKDKEKNEVLTKFEANLCRVN